MCLLRKMYFHLFIGSITSILCRWLMTEFPSSTMYLHIQTLCLLLACQVISLYTNWLYCSLTIMYCLACIYVVSPSLIVSIIAPCMSLCISISVEYVYCYTVGMSHSYHKCAFPYAFRTWSHDCSSCWTVTDRTNTQKTTVH